MEPQAFRRQLHVFRRLQNGRGLGGPVGLRGEDGGVGLLEGVPHGSLPGDGLAHGGEGRPKIRVLP